MSKQNYSEIEEKIRRLGHIYQKAPSERFIYSAKARLINQLILAEKDQDTRKLRFFGLNFALKSSAAFSIYIIGVGIGIIYASERSLPGQVLYPIKRFNETVILSSAFKPEQKAILKAEITSRRTDELIRLIEDGNDEEVKKASAELIDAVIDSKTDIENLSDDEKGKSEYIANELFRHQKEKLTKVSKKSDEKTRLIIEEVIEILDEEDDQKNKNGEVKGKKKEKKETSKEHGSNKRKSED